MRATAATATPAAATGGVDLLLGEGLGLGVEEPGEVVVVVQLVVAGRRLVGEVVVGRGDVACGVRWELKQGEEDSSSDNSDLIVSCS